MHACLTRGLPLASTLHVVFAVMVEVLFQPGGTRPAAAAASDTSVVNGPTCPDVMVIAARGSGEEPQSDWTLPLAYKKSDTSYGAGQINYDFYLRLVTAQPQLHFALDPVMYPAASVPSLLFDGVEPFHASEQSAAATIIDDVARTERVCSGGVKYVFAGYSQGAWAVQEALYQLEKSNHQVMGKIVGVALFGDPEFVPFQAIVRDNKPFLPLPGVARLPAPNYLPDPYKDVPPQLRSNTASYCLVGDFVCQDNSINFGLLAGCKLFGDAFNPNGTCIHSRYIVDGKTAKAADFVISNLPRHSIWPHLTLT